MSAEEHSDGFAGILPLASTSRALGLQRMYCYICDHPHPFPSRVEAIEEPAITLGDRVGA